MSPRRTRLLFIAAFTASMAVHGSLLALVGAAVARNRRAENAGRIEPVVLILPVEQPELQLGIDAPTPPSNAWLGFDKPEPQKAQPDVIEQAAFTDQPVAAAPPPTPDELPQPPDPPTQTPEKAESIQPPPPDQPHDPPPTPETMPISELLASLGLNQPPDPAKPPPEPPRRPDMNSAPSDDDPIQDFLQELDRSAEKHDPPAEPPKKAEDHPDETAREKPAQTQSAPPVAEQPPDRAVARKATPSTSDVGARADKESTPTSIIAVPRDQWQLGRPLAAHGLELKPRRPTLTILTLLTAAAGNPVCRIEFGRDGVPVRARLLQSSGDERIDEAILASLYRWRASGKDLERLHGEQTIGITMRLLLNRENREG